jgi:hypothetical protein
MPGPPCGPGTNTHTCGSHARPQHSSSLVRPLPSRGQPIIDPLTPTGSGGSSHSAPPVADDRFDRIGRDRFISCGMILGQTKPIFFNLSNGLLDPLWIACHTRHAVGRSSLPPHPPPAREQSSDRKIEIRIRERLIDEREVPPFLVIGPKAATRHRRGEQRAVRLRRRVHARVRGP